MTSYQILHYRSLFEQGLNRIIGSTVREKWFTLYLDLREGGDTHSEAIETVKAEMQVDAVSDERYYEAMKSPYRQNIR